MANQACSLESSEYQSAPTRSKVVKMKRAGTKAMLQKTMQSTQFDGLKVLTKEAIIQAMKDRQQ